MKKNPLVSIIIRTKNEERWLTPCLSSIFSQKYKNIEVIVVDNYSTDKTVEVAKSFKTKIVKIKKFFPGKAINNGIKLTKGSIIVCLSAHCIPLDLNWLSNLIKNLRYKKVAAVYGRQVPLPYSSPFDKRDLLNTFGLDKKVQKKDSFFHNANSAFKKNMWNKINFDEKAINIEDRIWAHNIIKLGYHIVYEPSASVYHYHGIHQNLDEKRCLGVVNILEKLGDNFYYKNFENSKNIKVNALLLQRGKLATFNNDYLINRTIASIKQSKYIKKIIVSTDSKKTIEMVKQKTDFSILRTKGLTKIYADIFTICKKALEIMEKNKIYSDVLLITTDNYPYRENNYYDKIIKKIIKSNFDLVLAKIYHRGSLWKEEGSKISCMQSAILPKELRNKNYFSTPFSYGFVTRPANIRNATFDFTKTGFVEIKNQKNTIEIQN
jgi:rhamnosyltransferase